MEVGLVRATIMSKLIGGLSGFWKFVMAELFFDDAGHHFAKSGIHLDLHGGGTAHLWFDCKIVVADEAALHGLLSCKGSSGLKCCCMCANIFNWKIDRGCIARDRSGTARYHTTHDFDSLVLHTPSSIDTIFRSLGAAAASELAELETRLGWKWELRSGMVDPAFRRQINPCASVTFDGMHCFFVSWCVQPRRWQTYKTIERIENHDRDRRVCQLVEVSTAVV